MDYHVAHQGQNLGVLPLDEIRRRRHTGALGPDAKLWQPGLTDWTPIDQILGAPLPAARTVSASRPFRWLWFGVVLGVFVIVGCLTAWWIVRNSQHSPNFIAQPAPTNTPTAPVKKRSASSSPDPAVIAAEKAAAEAAARERIADFPGTDRDGTSLVRIIAPRPDSRTYLTRLPADRAFRVRQYQQAYLRDGTPAPDPATEIQVREFFELWLDYHFSHAAAFSFESAQRRNQLQTQLYLASPPLPDALLQHTLVLNAELPREARARALENVLSLYANSAHRPYPRFNATIELANALGKDSPRLTELDQAALAHLRAALTAGHLIPDDQEILAESLVVGWAKRFSKRNSAALHELFEAQGPDWAWLSLVIDGELHLDAAWAARGGGYADTVTPAGWTTFAEELTAADAAYTAAWRLAPTRPLAPARLTYIAMGRSREDEMVRWFERTLDAQIDFLEVWASFTHALLPRWHGSHLALLRLARFSLDTRRFDTLVPYQITRIVDRLQDDLKLPFEQHLYAHPDVWPLYREMYEGYIAAPDRRGIERVWRCDYAVLAYLAGHLDVARAQLEAVAWQTAPASLEGWNADTTGAFAAIGALTGPDAARVRTAEDYWKANQRPPAAEIYRSLLETSPNPHTRELAQLRLRQNDSP